MTRQKGLIPRTALSTALVFIILGFWSAARAQWPSDPMVNLAIADRGGEQVLPKIASTPDRGCYVAWFDQALGGYSVYLQRLDRDGNEQWPHNGILISNHSQSSSLVEWDLISDSDGNAVLVFTDTRSGDDLDVFAYKVSPQGEMLWGPDGIALSDNDAFEPSPRVCQAGDGDFVFVWMHYPDMGDGAILMQRLSPEGIERLPHGGFAVITSPDEDPGFASVIPSGQSEVIVLWLRNIRSFSSPRHIMANRFDAAGTALWGAHRFVFDFTSVPIGYWPGVQPDGQGGALVWWHRSASNMFNCLVQHLDVNGAEAFAHNGVSVSTNTARHHLDPTLSYRAATGEIFVFWDERNSAQSQWGVYGQKFSAAGLRQWGDEGRVFLPVNTVRKLFARSAPYDDGAMVFFLEEPSSGLHRVLGLRVDNSRGARLARPLHPGVQPSEREGAPADHAGCGRRGQTRLGGQPERDHRRLRAEREPGRNAGTTTGRSGGGVLREPVGRESGRPPLHPAESRAWIM